MLPLQKEEIILFQRTCGRHRADLPQSVERTNGIMGRKKTKSRKPVSVTQVKCSQKVSYEM